ncbi:juvenile hormone esterase-like [Nomia melanderi]|uniref:juvenile hormone esterase-like n=1 Tax=Nomia melanderi TaxID=2448451 RepID=UPI003FCDFCAA
MRRTPIVGCTVLLFSVLSTKCAAQDQRCPPSPVVHTESGPVRGCVRETMHEKLPYLAFKGIPYADSPTGNNRFKPPQPVKPWTEVYDAIEERSACIQYDAFFRKSYLGDEDCLFLNVYVPQTSADDYNCRRCVMAWIPPGSFIAGYKDQDLYGPDLFLENGCVFVALNYRLGALGFLNLGIKEAMGNQGMKDQVAALRWVKRNIAKFCGDPENVTVMGQSSSSSSAILHTMSPMSRGLFKRIIAQSGSPISLSQPQAWARLSAAKLGARMGFATSNNKELWQNLMKATVTQIAHDQYHLYFGLPSDITLAFMPSDEDASVAGPDETFLSTPVWKLLLEGKFADVPCLIGKVDNEVLAFAKHAFRYLYIEVGNTTMELDVIARLARTISNVYFSGAISVNQRLMALYNRNCPVYYYLLKYNKFHHHMVDTFPVNQTTHCDDLGILFSSCKYNVNSCDDPNPGFYAFRRKMAKLWTNFAKFGNPTPLHDNPIDIIWKPSGLLGEQLILDEPFRMAVGP